MTNSIKKIFFIFLIFVFVPYAHAQSYYSQILKVLNQNSTTTIRQIQSFPATPLYIDTLLELLQKTNFANSWSTPAQTSFNFALGNLLSSFGNPRGNSSGNFAQNTQSNSTTNPTNSSANSPTNNSTNNSTSNSNSNSQNNTPSSQTNIDPNTNSDANPNPYLTTEQNNSTNSTNENASNNCNIPSGPIAYNIGGNNGDGNKCNAKTVFVGFDQKLKPGVFGGGYINPMTEKGNSPQGASLGNCKESGTASEYGEKCFSDYSTGSGQAYIDKQILHWKAEAAKAGQKCIPVDVDNCDSIGSKNYKAILDRIEFQNKGGATVKVLTKNPQSAGCNFFSHPAVVGAFVEEITPSDAKKIDKLRSKNQILLFARGGSGTNKKLKEIEDLKIKNSAYSYDTGSEYQTINNCTYNP